MVLLWHRRDQHCRLAGASCLCAPAPPSVPAVIYGVHTLTGEGVRNRHISTVSLTMNDCCYT
jgi:hypothetical protein